MLKGLCQKGRWISARLAVVALIVVSTVGQPAVAKTQTEDCIDIPYKYDLIPLDSFWDQANLDNLTAATAESQNGAIAAGYKDIRTEGWIYAHQHPGTIPLFIYWDQANLDNLTAATVQSEEAALNVGYSETRLEGWIYPDSEAGTGPLLYYWSDKLSDQYLLGTQDGQKGAIAAGYTLVGTEGYAYSGAAYYCGSVRFDDSP